MAAWEPGLQGMTWGSIAWNWSLQHVLQGTRAWNSSLGGDAWGGDSLEGGRAGCPGELLQGMAAWNSSLGGTLRGGAKPGE